MPKLRVNPTPRFETKVRKLMNEVALLGRSRKRTWSEADRVACELYPGLYTIYLKRLKTAAKGEI